MEQDPVVALERVEASLSEASTQASNETRALVLTLGIGGLLLTSTGLVSLSGGFDASGGVAQALSYGGGTMAAAGLFALAVRGDHAQTELRELRARRSTEEAHAALAHTVAAWERAAARERTRRIRRGGVLLAVGGVLVVGLGVGIAVAADTDQVSLATTTSLVAGLLGVVFGVEGVRALTSPDPLESGWNAHRRWSPPALRPVASWTPRGPSLGLVATF